MVKFLLGVQSPRLLSVVILVPFFGWGEWGLWFGFETSKERRKNVVSNSPEGLLQVSCKNQRFFFSYCSPCQALKQLSINIGIILPESPQTEICQITESWFELISANHLQHHQPYVTWNPHPSALQNQSEKPTHWFWRTQFSLFYLSVKNHHCRKTSFFSVGLFIDSSTIPNTGCFIDTFRALQPVPTPLNTFCAYDPISGWPTTPASNHSASCQHFILPRLLFKLGGSLLTLQKSVF